MTAIPSQSQDALLGVPLSAPPMPPIEYPESDG